MALRKRGARTAAFFSKSRNLRGQLCACSGSFTPASSPLRFIMGALPSFASFLFCFSFFILTKESSTPLAGCILVGLSGGRTGYAHSFPPSPFSPFTLSFSGLQAGARKAPPLGIKENEACLFKGSPPENVLRPQTTVKLAVTQWAQHKDDEVFVQHELKAYQTSDTPGRERQFAITFQLPQGLVQQGKAQLFLRKTWDGATHGWICHEHVLEIIRLTDDKYLMGRNAQSEAEKIEAELDFSLETYFLDVSFLVYEHGLAGEPLHLLIREKIKGCLSGFAGPKDEEPPRLEVQVESVDPVDATYGTWEPFSPCRVSCVIAGNFQCRKRDCSPGQNAGLPCKSELMVDKQPCADAAVSAPCSCDTVDKEGACPAGSSCDDSTPNAVKCSCRGIFSRESVYKETVCEGKPSRWRCPYT